MSSCWNRSTTRLPRLRGRASRHQHGGVAELLRELLQRLIEARKDDDFLALIDGARTRSRVVAPTFAAASFCRAFVSSASRVRPGAPIVGGLGVAGRGRGAGRRAGR